MEAVERTMASQRMAVFTLPVSHAPAILYYLINFTSVIPEVPAT